MSLPAQRLYLHHSVTAAANGVSAVKTVANIGIGRFGRSSYSFACTLDGTLYELQGNRIGAHTAGQNSTSLAVCLVGNYETTQITEAQIEAVAWLHGELVRRGWLVRSAPLQGHRNAPGASTACPGRTAYAALPKIRARLGSTPSPTPKEGFLMALTDAEQKELLRLAREDRLGRDEKEITRPHLNRIEETLAEIKEMVRQDRLGRDEKEVTRPHLNRIEDTLAEIKAAVTDET
jgi:HAMP domain-containing protein